MNETSKLCCNCIHLLGKRPNLEDAVIKWRCQHPSNVSSRTVDLVTGTPIVVYAAASIYNCRLDGANCGTQGKLFEPYVPPAWSTGATNATTKLHFHATVVNTPSTKLKKNIDLSDI